MLDPAVKGTAIIRIDINYVFNSRHGVKAQRVCIFENSTVRSSNLA